MGRNGINNTLQIILKSSYKQTWMSWIVQFTNGRAQRGILSLFFFYSFTFSLFMPFNQQVPVRRGNNDVTNLLQTGPQSTLGPQTRCWSGVETLRRTRAPGTSQSTPATSPASENHYRGRHKYYTMKHEIENHHPNNAPFVSPFFW